MNKQPPNVFHWDKFFLYIIQFDDVYVVLEDIIDCDTFNHILLLLGPWACSIRKVFYPHCRKIFQENAALASSTTREQWSPRSLGSSGSQLFTPHNSELLTPCTIRTGKEESICEANLGAAEQQPLAVMSPAMCRDSGSERLKVNEIKQLTHLKCSGHLFCFYNL